MTNPNNAIGTNGAFDGRTSPNALNDLTAAFTRGIVSGWNCSPKSGMTVQLGGSASVRDVALAEDNAGDKLTINNRSGAPVEVTLAGAPATNNRIDAIVAYVDNPSTGDGTTTDNPTACGIIAVSGTVAANPTAPTETQIRSAITTDGATGGVAYYVVLATIRVGTNVTSIGSGVITQGQASKTDLIEIQDGSISTPKIQNAAVTSQKIDWTSLASTPWVDGTFNSGFTQASNANYNKRKIQACIYAGFLFIKFAASRSGGSDFSALTEYTIGTIPSTINGVDISNLTTLAKGNLMRFFLDGGSGNIGWCQLNGTSITIEFKTGATNWCVGEMMIPLNV
jgi:hypothetical protein